MSRTSEGQQPTPGKLFGGRIPYSVTIFGVLVLAVAAFTAIFAYCEGANPRAIIGFFALAVTAAAGIGSVYYLANTLRLHLEREKSASAFGYMARWNSPDLFYGRKVCYEVLEAFKDQGADKVREVLANKDSESNIRHIVNFLKKSP